MTPAGPKRAVVFDLDGTLIDSLPLVLEAIAHALEPFGARPPADIFARLGGPPERFMPTLLADIAHVPTALARFEAFHHGNVHLVRPYERAAAVLAALRQADVPVAVWTGRDRVSTAWLLREHGLEEYFKTVVCGDDLPSHKPDSAGLREILRRLDVTAGETLFVGDADVDVLGGVGCGVDTLLIRHARAVDPGIAAQAWRAVGSPDDAYNVVLACIRAIA
jgi:phosphoglycolate phosphatase-like HAD superfamily hydrolase